MILTFSLLLSGCAGVESASPAANEVNKEDKLEEQKIQVDLTHLEGKIWSNSHEKAYLYFKTINENTIEFQYLSPKGYRMQEQTFTVDVSNITANSIDGNISKVTADIESPVAELEMSKFKLTRQNDLYKISVENLLDFELEESILTLDDWAVSKNTVKELTEREALELIYQAEASATKSFSDAFTENAEGFSFNQPFETIVSTVKNYYTKNYQSHSLREVYEDPSIMYETLYAFPLSEVPKENFLVDASEEKIKIYYEADLYGSPSLYLYTLIIEDSLWKIQSRNFLLSPNEAAHAAKALSDAGDDPEILAEPMESTNFHDYIETILTGSRFHIKVFDEYEGLEQIYGLYQVDPVTGVVYFYDQVIDKAYELGTAFEQ